MIATNFSQERYWHPYLIALFPVLSLYATNESAVRVADVLLPLVAVMIFAVLTVTVFKALLPSREKAFLAASWTIGCFFSYGIVFVGGDYVYRTFRHGFVWPHWLGLPTWGVIWLSGTIFIFFWRRGLDRANRFVNLMSLFLLVIAILAIARNMYSEDRLEASTHAALDRRQFALQMPSPARDVYFLVFDRYAGANTLLNKYGFDNSKFLDALRSRGFTVTPDSRANYPRTLLSMASAFNCEYLPEESQSDLVYAEMLQNNVVVRSLVDIGYTYLHFGNWYQPLRSNKAASYNMPLSILQSEFAESIYEMTPLSKILRVRNKYHIGLERFQEIAEVARDAAPTFVYGHFLLPHPPYVFAADTSQVPWAKSRFGDTKDLYIGQLEATNTLILKMVDEVLESSTATPIIVLLSDEGPYLLTEEANLDPKRRILSRSSILSAYLLPGEDAEGPPTSISPVNTFRLIFDRYFGTHLGLLPDRTYYWEASDESGRPAIDNKRFIDETDLLDAD